MRTCTSFIPEGALVPEAGHLPRSKCRWGSERARRALRAPIAASHASERVRLLPDRTSEPRAGRAAERRPCRTTSAERQRRARSGRRGRGPLRRESGHSIHKHVEVERLRHLILSRHPCAFLVLQGGHEDHRDSSQCRIAKLLGPELPPVHHGHHEVEQDECGPNRIATKSTEGFRSILHPHRRQSFATQDLDHQVADASVILHHHHRRRRHRHASIPLPARTVCRSRGLSTFWKCRGGKSFCRQRHLPMSTAVKRYPAGWVGRTSRPGPTELR